MPRSLVSQAGPLAMSRVLIVDATFKRIIVFWTSTPQAATIGLSLVLPAWLPEVSVNTRLSVSFMLHFSGKQNMS
jgi:hypothetical protein